MPYLNNKIQNHKKGCTGPSVKRLYVRDYDQKGRQKFVPFGIVCTDCGVSVVEEYQRNLTPVQRKRMDEEETKLSKYTDEQRRQFEEIDKEYFMQSFTVLLTGSNIAKRAVIREWGNKLKAAGMVQNELGRHVSSKILGSPQDALNVKNMGREKRDKLENIVKKLK